MGTQTERALAGLLAVSVLSTAIHYSDNAIALEAYPASGLVTITPLAVVIAWVLLMSFGLAGWLLYRRGRLRAALACLGVYALTGLSTPLHYLEGSPGELPWWRNASIALDGAAGAAVLGFVAWSALARRRADRPLGAEAAR